MARQYYKDSTTGQMKPLGVKVEDTLPIGATIDYDGTDIPEGYEEANDKVVLYDNASGDNGTITLSDSASNYDYLEIYFSVDAGTGGRISMQKVDLSISHNCGLSSINADTGGTMYIRSRDITINGTSIATLNGTRYSYVYIPSSGTPTLQKLNDIYICKVIGYKEV